ncbi:MAG: hypothetical protein RSA20_00335 [Oscillospiraceae bacterium]
MLSLCNYCDISLGDKKAAFESSFFAREKVYEEMQGYLSLSLTRGKCL